MVERVREIARVKVRERMSDKKFVRLFTSLLVFVRDQVREVIEKVCEIFQVEVVSL